MDHAGEVALRGKLKRENDFFPAPRPRLRIWSRETGSAVPPRVSLLNLRTEGESGARSRDSSQFPAMTSIYFYLCQSRVHQVTQIRTDGIHCRGFADSEPVILKVVPVTGAAFSDITVGQFLCAFFSPLLQYILYRYMYPLCVQQTAVLL